MDINDQPTEPWQPGDLTQQSRAVVGGGNPSWQTHATTSAAVGPRKQQITRRKVLGASVLGLIGLGAAAAGGVSLEQWWQRGGFSNLYHGPIASNAQIGHLLRRAGFGASQDEIPTYANPGYTGAVDRLLNYQQVSDADMENRVGELRLQGCDTYPD